MNIRPYLMINGVSSQMIQGLLISSLAPISKPPIRTEIETVSGRDGDSVTVLGYGAYDKTVTVGLTYDYDIDKIIKFFDSEGVVVFSNEPDKYYRFAIYEAIDFERLINFKTAEIVFHCQPFKYSVKENPKSYEITTNPVTAIIFNAGNIYARPTLEITGAGVITVSLNGAQILSIDLGENSRKIIIDSDKMDAYDDNGILLNRLVTGNYDNIKLKSGSNIFELGGAVTAFTISNYSRWI